MRHDCRFCNGVGHRRPARDRRTLPGARAARLRRRAAGKRARASRQANR